MQTARLQLQGVYSLLAGLLLLLGVPLYQSLMLVPAGYQSPAATAYSQGNFAPLLLWISSHSQPFALFRLLEFATFLLILRLPLALARSLRSYGSTLARWVLFAGTGGIVLFGAMIALGTYTLLTTASTYQQAATPAAQRDLLTSFQGYFGIEGLLQNTLAGVLLALFLLCASLLIARTGKLSALLAYFGLLAAALLAGLALLYAFSPLDDQTQLTTPALAAFAIWLIWLAIILLRRARRLLTPTTITAPAAQSQPATSEPPQPPIHKAGQPATSEPDQPAVPDQDTR
jgi:hypothetical protein